MGGRLMVPNMPSYSGSDSSSYRSWYNDTKATIRERAEDYVSEEQAEALMREKFGSRCVHPDKLKVDSGPSLAQVRRAIENAAEVVRRRVREYDFIINRIRHNTLPMLPIGKIIGGDGYTVDVIPWEQLDEDSIDSLYALKRTDRYVDNLWAPVQSALNEAMIPYHTVDGCNVRYMTDIEEYYKFAREINAHLVDAQRLLKPVKDEIGEYESTFGELPRWEMEQGAGQETFNLIITSDDYDEKDTAIAEAELHEPTVYRCLRS